MTKTPEQGRTSTDYQSKSNSHGQRRQPNYKSDSPRHGIPWGGNHQPVRDR